MKKDSSEFQKFDQTMRELIKVPHTEIKSKLDAEKAAKKKLSKPTRTKRNDQRI